MDKYFEINGKREQKRDQNKHVNGGEFSAHLIILTVQFDTTASIETSTHTISEFSIVTNRDTCLGHRW